MPSKKKYPWQENQLSKGAIMKEIGTLRTTNTIIWILSLIGGVIVIGVGIAYGECIDLSYGECYEYTASPELIAYGIVGILFATLMAQVIYLFAAHVEASHKN
jgi:hypothetical protein